jgi:crotonobetainyl-CoA:carnitine CoA-transferase CaiB-like acyl-CoA transferase
VSILHEAVHHPGHDDKLLDLCSGIEVLLARFDALLDTHASGDGAAVDSPLVDAVLGMIAIRNRLAATFAAASTEPARPARAHTDPAHASAQESLLR